MSHLPPYHRAFDHSHGHLTSHDLPLNLAELGQRPMARWQAPQEHYKCLLAPFGEAQTYSIFFSQHYQGYAQVEPAFAQARANTEMSAVLPAADSPAGLPTTAQVVAQIFTKIATLTNKRQTFIVTDSNVQAHYGEFLRQYGYVHVLQAGESAKDFTNVYAAITAMLSQGYKRDCVVVAFGGGVVGDFAGFLASIYQRGVDFVQVPTSLLSMVDSSVGGKVGVNHELGKNMIGSFKKPLAVFIEPLFLQTLPLRELNAGLAEALKLTMVLPAVALPTQDTEFGAGKATAIKAELDLLVAQRKAEILAKGTDFSYRSALASKPSPECFDATLVHLGKIIEDAVSTKAYVVALDPFEKGIRKLLNYGHTYGHALESYGLAHDWDVLHGECVMWGMLLANELTPAAQRPAGFSQDAAEFKDTVACLGLSSPRAYLKDVAASGKNAPNLQQGSPKQTYVENPLSKQFQPEQTQPVQVQTDPLEADFTEVLAKIYAYMSRDKKNSGAQITFIYSRGLNHSPLIYPRKREEHFADFVAAVKG